MTETEGEWPTDPRTTWRGIIKDWYFRVGRRLSSLEYWFVITGLGFICVIGYETGALSPPAPPKDLWMAWMLYVHIPLCTAFTAQEAADRFMEGDG